VTAKGLAPLLKRLEERDRTIAALEARIEALEDRTGGRA
jgi:hypothetical protein